jgi:hypothetical protein
MIIGIIIGLTVWVIGIIIILAVFVKIIAPADRIIERMHNELFK